MKMKALLFVVLCLLSGMHAMAQVADQDSIAADSIVFNAQLHEIVISNFKDSVSEEDKKQLYLLRRRVLKVYPYAKVGAERLTALNANMAKLKSEKEKKRYAKMVENYLQDEFEGQLKKLSHKEGQILVKLIYRQTGKTTFDLIKEQKSGWKAFWSNRVARVFKINLKTGYSPGAVPEDYLIEGILIKAFEEHRLVKQDPAFNIDYVAIKKAWRAKSKKSEG